MLYFHPPDGMDNFEYKVEQSYQERAVYQAPLSIRSLALFYMLCAVNYMDPSHWLLLQPHLAMNDLLRYRRYITYYYLKTTLSLSQAQHRLRTL